MTEKKKMIKYNMMHPSIEVEYIATWYINQTWTLEHMISNLKLCNRENYIFDRFWELRRVMRRCLRIISRRQIRKALHVNLIRLIFEGGGDRQGGKILFNTLNIIKGRDGTITIHHYNILLLSIACRLSKNCSEKYFILGSNIL